MLIPSLRHCTPFASSDRKEHIGHRVRRLVRQPKRQIFKHLEAAINRLPLVV